MWDLAVHRLHAEAVKLDSVTTGYITRHIAHDVAGRLMTVRVVVSALVDAFGATLYFAALRYMALYLRSSLGRVKILMRRVSTGL
ncbi:MAG: hypothetical protein JWN43_970 [Gammaproteobacteria bacterium]|nr:hypothetical protein [Gammaproteobacteria bacterium]